MAIQTSIDNRSQTLTTNTTITSGTTITAGTSVAAGTTVTAATGLVSTTGGVTATGNSSISGGTIALNATGTNLIDATGVLELNSSAGVISIGNDAVNQNMNIGTAGTRTITIGSATGSAAMSNVAITGGSITGITDLAVADGGTGVSTMTTAYAPVCAGTTATGALQVASTGLGTAGFILTSNGSAALPSFQASSGTGDVTAASNLTDNAVVRGDGGAKGVQTSTMLITDAGEMTNPSQPAVLAALDTSDANATGDGTAFTLGSGNALIEIFDQGGDFVTSGTFTAPVTGRYQLNMSVLLQDVAAANTPALRIATSNTSWLYGNWATGVIGNMPLGMNVLADMDSADTATFDVIVGGGTKIVDIFGGGGSSDRRTFISIALIC